MFSTPTRAQQLGLSGQQAGLGHDDLLPGIQGFSGMDDVAGQGFGAEGLGNHFPLAMGDDGQEIRDVSQFVQSIQERVKMFDECYNKRVAALQMEISRAEKDRSEEVERNRMSISSLMTNVDDLMKKLGERGVAVHQPMPQQAPMAAFSADVAGPTTTNAAAAAVAAATATSAAAPVQPPQQAEPEQQKRVCQHCGKSGRVLLCGRCKSATFCNQECQREAWATHSKTCIPKTD